MKRRKPKTEPQPRNPAQDERRFHDLETAMLDLLDRIQKFEGKEPRT